MLTLQFSHILPIFYLLGALNISFYYALYHRHSMLTLQFSHILPITANTICGLLHPITEAFRSDARPHPSIQNHTGTPGIPAVRRQEKHTVCYKHY